MPKLSVIVLSYNTEKLTTACAVSLVKRYGQDLKSGYIEVFVADNASSDNTVESLKKIEGIKIIQNKENFGFSKGNNLGAKNARGEYILFLNSDVEVFDDGFLRMIEFMDNNPKVGILGGKLANSDGSDQKSAGNFYTLINLLVTLFGGDSLMRKSPKRIQMVDWVSGASLMIRRNLFERLKGFDERFFMYMEDMDLCFRTRNLGFSTYFYPDIKLMHKELGSGNRTFAVLNIYKGILLFYRKHKAWQYPIVRFLLFLKAFISLTFGLLTNDTYLKRTYFNALRLSL